MITIGYNRPVSAVERMRRAGLRESENMKLEVTDIQGEKEVFEADRIDTCYGRVTLYDGDGVVVMFREAMVDTIKKVE